MSKPSDRLAKLKVKRDQLSARIQKLQAHQKTKERKQDTRRKILIGAYCLDKAKQENTLQELYQAVSQYLTRESDIKLFKSTFKENESMSEKKKTD